MRKGIAVTIVVGLLLLDLVVVFAVARAIKASADEANRPVKVVVVTEEIRRGTDGTTASSAGSLQVREVPARYAPSEAVTSAGDVEALRASITLAPGTIVTRGHFADPSAVRQPVLVAVDAVANGQPLDQAVAAGTITTATVPPDIEPANALTSTDQLRGKVAAIDIAGQTVLTRSMLDTP